MKILKVATGLKNFNKACETKNFNFERKSQIDLQFFLNFFAKIPRIARIQSILIIN